MPFNVFLLDMQAGMNAIAGGPPAPAPMGRPVMVQYLDHRLTELERAARKASTRVNQHDNTLIVAPEGFFGVAVCPYDSRWAHVKQRLKVLSNSYPDYLFVAGTAKRTRGLKVRSCCRVVQGGRKLLNIYKTVAAGASDGYPGIYRWDTSLKRRQTPGSNDVRRRKTGRFAWGGMSCGGEVCNDARQKILYNEVPINNLDLVVWVTRELYLGGGGQNEITMDNFPLANGGYLVQCGSGDGTQASYVPAGGGQSGNYAVNPPQGNTRLGVYQRTAALAHAYNTIDPTGWSNLHNPPAQRYTDKVVYWLNLP